VNDPKKSSKIRRVVNSNCTDFYLHSKPRETTRNRLFTNRKKRAPAPSGSRQMMRTFSVLVKRTVFRDLICDTTFLPVLLLLSLHGATHKLFVLLATSQDIFSAELSQITYNHSQRHYLVFCRLQLRATARFFSLRERLT
jgi:hypothetical protein